MESRRPAADERTGETLLVGDLGGTRVRLALARGERLGARRAADCGAETDPVALLRSFIDEEADEPPRRAVLAVAGPVVDGEVRFANRPWVLSESGLRDALGLAQMVLINDLEAVAHGIDPAGTESLPALKPGRAVAGATYAVLGVGTGLGVSVAIPGPAAPTVTATEGGHRDLAAGCPEEWAIVELLSRRHDHVSAERVLSGSGLAELHRCLRQLEGAAPEAAIDAAGIQARAGLGDELARRTLRRFSAWLGAFAGDLALTVGARGGLFVAGGVLPRLGEDLDRDLFIRRFVAKGRFRDYLEPIPVWLLEDPDIALRGCARAA